MSLLQIWLESLHEDMKVSSKCSRTRNRKSTCTYCLEQCKFEAMRVNDHLISIDTERCKMCGECMIACPLSAIEGIATSRRFKKGSLIFDESYVPTIKELLIYKKRGLTSLQVNDEPINQGWNSVLKTANEQLTLLNERPIDVVQNDKIELLSRRAFFHSFHSKGKKLAKNLTPVAWRFGMDDWKLNKYYPDFQFFKVEIDNHKCNFCQSCFSLCAEEVFKVMDGLLQIKDEKCLNCTSCIDVCSANAIEISPEVKRKEERVEPYFINNCDGCGHQYFTFQQELTQCPTCMDRNPEWLSPY
jgi:Fe-S-cluster-containing hydrogenase component 2